jgi:carbon storage regulator
MLVVTRRRGQSVLIGGDIEVFVLEVDGFQVRVGINAPREIHVLRRELLTQGSSETVLLSPNRPAIRRALQSIGGPGERATNGSMRDAAD